jgi:SAM-dependent methyltransferase
MNESYFEQNKKLWNKKVRHHFDSAFYNVKGFKAGESSLTEIEKAELPDLTGKTLLHLQCHFGQDTLSLARLGAQVTGVDFSENAIKTARELSTELNLNARFIEANIYDLPRILQEEYDVVFTTYGTIPWLPDLQKWAEIISKSLKKGGLFYFADFHPTFYLFNFDNKQVEFSYFNEGKPYEEFVSGTYADPLAPINEKEYFWNHAIEEVISPLLENGFSLEAFREYDFSPFNCFPNMEETQPGRYQFNMGGLRIPHIYMLQMRKL